MFIVVVGRNDHGQLGSSTTTDRLAPKEVFKTGV